MITKTAGELLNQEFVLVTTDGYKAFRNKICTVQENVNHPGEYELHALPKSDRCYGIYFDSVLDVILKEDQPEYFL